MKLWLDDIRPVPDDTWTRAYNAEEAIEYLKTGQVVEASLDHDLGACLSCGNCSGYSSKCGCRCHLSGNFVTNWMVTEGVFPVKVTVHSQNPIGAQNMVATLNRYGPYDGKVKWTPAFYSEEQLKEKRK